MSAAAEQSNISGGSKVAGIVAALEGWSLRHAHAVGTITDAFRERVLRFGIDAQKVSLTANYTQAAVKPMDRNECRDYFSWDRDKFVVLHTGNMGLKQDLGTAIEAARLLVNSMPELALVLAGDGNQRESLEKQAAGLRNVHFLPLVPNEDYSKLLGMADALLLIETANQTEMSLPSKLTSYIAATRPILAAVPASGPTAMALPNTATVIPSKNPLSLAKAIQELVHTDRNNSEVKSSEVNKRLRVSWAVSTTNNRSIGFSEDHNA